MENCSLTSLGLRDNQIGPTGMEILAAFLGRQDCPVTELQIKGNTMGNDGACYLATALETNISLRVCSCLHVVLTI